MTLRRAIIKIVKESFPSLFFRGVFRFRVVKFRDGRIDLQPVSAKWLSDIPLAEVWTGIGGGTFVPQEGSEVLIAFIDGDDTQPAIVGAMPLSYTIGKPLSVSLDADTLNVGDAIDNAVRYGDTVSIGMTSGPIMFVSTPSRPVASKVKL